MSVRPCPPSGGKLAGFRRLFEDRILVFSREMPFRAVARLTGMSPHRARSLRDRYVDPTVAPQDLPGVETPTVDESSQDRGHDDVTAAADSACRAVILPARASPGRASWSIRGARLPRVETSYFAPQSFGWAEAPSGAPFHRAGLASSEPDSGDFRRDPGPRGRTPPGRTVSQRGKRSAVRPRPFSPPVHPLPPGLALFASKRLRAASKLYPSPGDPPCICHTPPS